MTIVWLDTETTGLDPHRHQVVEVAYAIADGPIESFVVPHHLAGADAKALEINRYFARGLHNQPTDAEVDHCIAEDLAGVTLAGFNPAFDAAMLRARWGFAPWHHRLLDVEAYAAGVFNEPGPLGTRDVVKTLRGLGFEIPEPDHTAAGDVATARACYHALRHYGENR